MEHNNNKSLFILLLLISVSFEQKSRYFVGRERSQSQDS